MLQICDGYNTLHCFRPQLSNSSALYRMCDCPPDCEAVAFYPMVNTYAVDPEMLCEEFIHESVEGLLEPEESLAFREKHPEYITHVNMIK